ncbi:hypothetical protein [Microvirga brassicacearum]|uniref:hypothetical protein n=1 Tax=Microvirga brassicacearum TaxID=2580413 RepID=UPI0019126A2B|nr:hypothetical protein [Microvirga brassicacearum]
MNLNYLVHAAFLLTGIAVASGQAVAQDAAKKTHVPLQKTIGVATATAPEPSLAVINSAGARLEGDKLILTGVSANSIVFADRPVRAAGHVTTEQFIMQWDQGKDSFAIDPPNATISVLGGNGSDVADAVVTLKSAKLEGTTLTFDVAILEGKLNGATGPAALFIDFFAARWGGAGGFHGVAAGGGYRGGAYWHAPVYRGAWYGAGAGAAVGAAVAGAAVGAAVAAPYYNPYAPPPPPPCGYYPYPRCY